MSGIGTGKVPSDDYLRQLESRLNDDPQFNIELLTFRLFELASHADRTEAVSIMEEMGRWQAIADGSEHSPTK